MRRPYLISFLTLCLFASSATAKEVYNGRATGRNRSSSNRSTKKLRGNDQLPRQLKMNGKNGKGKDNDRNDFFTDREDNTVNQGNTIINLGTPPTDNRIIIAPGVTILKAPRTPAPAPTSPPPTTRQPTLKPTTPRPTLKPTTPRPTLKPTTPRPTLKPTTPRPTLKPTTPRPTLTSTTPRPTQRPTLRPNTQRPTLALTGEVPKVTGRWPLNTCSARTSLPFWDDPEYAKETKCFFSEECNQTPYSCCLADKCLCGVYRLKSDDCVPTIDKSTRDNTEDRIDSTGGGAVVPIGPGPSDNICERPENQGFWDVTKYPEYANEPKCTSSRQCRYNQNTCCLAQFCICGFFRPGFVNTDCIPEY